MTFTQILEVRSSNEQGLHEIARTWHQEQFGVAPGYQGIRILADRDQAGRFVIVVDFTPAEEATTNNSRPETQAWASKLAELVTAEPTYRNCRQVCSSYPMTSSA